MVVQMMLGTATSRFVRRKMFLDQSKFLNLRAHGPIKDQDPVLGGGN
jgi:hypothetical protein